MAGNFLDILFDCPYEMHNLTAGALTLRERQFLEEYSKIAKKQGKDAVIRRENKTKRRKIAP